MNNYININKNSKKNDINTVKINDSKNNCNNKDYINLNNFNLTKTGVEGIDKQNYESLCRCCNDKSNIENYNNDNCIENLDNYCDKCNNCCDKCNGCCDKCNDCCDKCNDCCDKCNNCCDKCNNCCDKCNDCCENKCNDCCENKCNNCCDKCNDCCENKCNNYCDKCNDCCENKCNNCYDKCNNCCENKCNNCCSSSECCELNNIIESIALQEAGIAHILSAEGEKIQKALTLDVSFNDLIALNAEVSKVIAGVTNLEIVLNNKLKTVLGNNCCEKKCSGCLYVQVKDCGCGEPICGATIIIKKICKCEQLCGETDICGKYKKCGLPCGKYCVEVCYKNEMKQQEIEITCNCNCINLDFCFNVIKCCGVDLTITDCATGCAISGACITLYDINNNVIKKDITDCKGKFKYKCLVFGEYKIIVKDCASSQEIIKEFEVTENNCFVKMCECFTRCDCNKTVIVSGKVVNKCGSGVPFAKVYVTTERAYNLIADDCGNYRISLLNCKTVSLVAYCAGQLSVTHTLNMPTAGVNVVNLRLL